MLIVSLKKCLCKSIPDPTTHTHALDLLPQLPAVKPSMCQRLACYGAMGAHSVSIDLTLSIGCEQRSKISTISSLNNLFVHGCLTKTQRGDISRQSVSYLEITIRPQKDAPMVSCKLYKRVCGGLEIKT